jgi:hypothetical protein
LFNGDYPEILLVCPDHLHLRCPDGIIYPQSIITDGELLLV